MCARDTLSQITAPSLRFKWSYGSKPARDRRGFLSHLVPAFLDFKQAGLEESGASLHVTPVRSCPTFPGLVVPHQHVPSGSLRVTRPPEPPPRRTRQPSAEPPPRAGAHGSPADADARRLENPVDRSRGERVRYGGAAPRRMTASSSAGALQPDDEGDTTFGRTSISSAPPLPLRRVWAIPKRARHCRGRKANRMGGSILTSRSGSILASA